MDVSFELSFIFREMFAMDILRDVIIQKLIRIALRKIRWQGKKE